LEGESGGRRKGGRDWQRRQRINMIFNIALECYRLWSHEGDAEREYEIQGRREGRKEGRRGGRGGERFRILGSRDLANIKGISVW
jgi:hypothetical protein